MRSSFLGLGLLAIVACDDPASRATVAEVAEHTPGAQSGPSGATDTFSFSQEGSTLAWTGSKITASHDGGFRQFSGTVEVDSAGDVSRVDLTVQTASIFADHENLTKHLRDDDFFDVENHPEARFETTSIEPGAEGEGATHTVTGNLTLRGRTKTIRFPVAIQIGDSVKAAAEFSIDRQDYGITYPGLPDDLIRDRVVIRFDIDARPTG